MSRGYNSEVVLDLLYKETLNLSNQRSINSDHLEFFKHSDISKAGWGKWSQVKRVMQYKYTRTEASKICYTNTLQIQKGLNSPFANGKLSSISFFSKNGVTRILLMIQNAKEIRDFF